MTKDEALKLALEWFEKDGEPDHHPVVTAIKEALANEALDKMAENARELGLDYEPAQPEFIKHEVKNADDWSEWVCPDPKNYLMKCCDCGLVHEAEFGVVRYKSETERDDCDMVDDPNLQAVFRMRRSEEWTPEDTAHRSGGLPMAQLEQEPVVCDCDSPSWCKQYKKCNRKMLGFMPYVAQPQRTWVGLTEDEILSISAKCAASHQHMDIQFARAIESKLKEKNVVC